MLGVSYLVFALAVFSFSSDRLVLAYETCASNDLSNCTNVCGPHQELTCHGGFCGCAHNVGISGSCSGGDPAGCKGTCTYFADEFMTCNGKDQCRCFHKTHVFNTPAHGTCLGMDVSQCGPCPHQNDAIVCHTGKCHCHHAVTGSCDANVLTGCTGKCDSTSALICYESKCYCDHVITPA